ncbi:MFS transporter [Oceanispirochaeta sp.]|uniref:MFS transporter n=1 Tax=Oceanispirochaeta sp. TaxID=2035350 RepID=UPI0026304419|nr:MFS transporter [Oceanispirochaeta sp.]MDA3958403.1 MFS transporter [Oceanispirochaeta sp.]
MKRLVERAAHLPFMRGMSHNGRVVLFTEPFWAIPFNMIIVYATLYMQALGLSDRQIGLTQTLLVTTQILSSLFSGVLTDKFGRKRTTIFFDMISWAVACLVWSFSKSLTGFIIAAFLNGLNKVVQVSFSCMMTEDADSSQRLRNYSGLHFMVLCCGFFAPLGGLLINRLGLIDGTRLLYFWSAIVMAIMFIVRNWGWNEPAQHPEQQKGQTLKGFLKALRFFLASTESRIIFLLQGINQFFKVFKPLFYFVYLSKNAGLKSSSLSLVPMFSSLMMMVILLLVLPRIKTSMRGWTLSLGFLLGSLSLGMLIASPRLGFAVLWASVLLDAFSLALIRPLLDSLWADHLEDKNRARQLSAGHFFFGLFAVPAGSLAAELYTRSPGLPFAAAGLLLLAAFLLSVKLNLKAGKQNE